MYNFTLLEVVPQPSLAGAYVSTKFIAVLLLTQLKAPSVILDCNLPMEGRLSQRLPEQANPVKSTLSWQNQFSILWLVDLQNVHQLAEFLKNVDSFVY